MRRGVARCEPNPPGSDSTDPCMRSTVRRNAPLPHARHPETAGNDEMISSPTRAAKEKAAAAMRAAAAASTPGTRAILMEQADAMLM